ncbi:MAG TPA: GNAT family N-acetyltransferase [Bradyrhizobium sp.]|nr:GNAT family N-acetyltransferase [Bradyrhizobium sp.]
MPAPAIIVAEDRGQVIGAVACDSPQVSKAAFFEPAWPVIRMLVVDPTERDRGIGRQLTVPAPRRA